MIQDLSQSNPSRLVVSLKWRTNVARATPKVNICENITLQATLYSKELVYFATLSFDLLAWKRVPPDCVAEALLGNLEVSGCFCAKMGTNKCKVFGNFLNSQVRHGMITLRYTKWLDFETLSDIARYINTCRKASS